jgi:hypothetical protein
LGAVRCEECGAEADENARGWRAFLGNDPRDPDDEPQGFVYCPDCAERDFDRPQGFGPRLVGS